MIQHPSNKLEGKLFEEKKHPPKRRRKSPVRKIREDLKQQETEHELKMFRDGNLEAEHRGSDSRFPVRDWGDLS